LFVSPVSVVNFALHRKYGGTNPKANYTFMHSVTTSTGHLVFYLEFNSGYYLS